MCICDYVKTRIGTCNLCFGGKKGYKRMSVPGSPKTYCYETHEINPDI